MTAETEIRHRIDDLQREAGQRKEETSVLEQHVADAQKRSADVEGEETRLAKELKEIKTQVEVAEKEVQSLLNSLETRKRRIDGLRMELERETNRVCIKVSPGEETT